MPIYEYECDENGHRFEKWQSVHDAPIRVCEICGAPVHKVIQPVGIIFKGSGWYKTDNRPKPVESGETKSETKSVGKTETKTETKTDTKTESKPSSGPNGSSGEK